MPTLPLALLALASVALAQNDNAVHLALQHRHNLNNASPELYQAMGAAMRSKYGAHEQTRRAEPLELRASSDNGSVFSLDLQDLSLDSSYSATVHIGTPSQSFQVIVDTGSADLWIASPQCLTCDMVPFNSSQSSSFKLTGESIRILYGSGAASGVVGTDTVTLGDHTVTGQTLAVISSITSGIKVNNVSGLMGLGFESISSTKKTPFWVTAVQQGGWAQPLMGFYFERWIDRDDATAVEYGGELTLGGTNTSAYTGTVDWVDLPLGRDGGFWNILMRAVSLMGNISLPINAKTLGLSTTPDDVWACIDTGTTLIGAPPAWVDDFYSMVPGAEPGTGSWEGYYIYPCDVDIKLTLNFGSQSWTVSEADFQLLEVSKGMCAGGLYGIQTSGGPRAPTFIVGALFLKNVYSVFRANPPSVGFATLALPGDPAGQSVTGVPLTAGAVATTAAAVWGRTLALSALVALGVGI